MPSWDGEQMHNLLSEIWITEKGKFRLFFPAWIVGTIAKYLSGLTLLRFCGAVGSMVFKSRNQSELVSL